MKLSLMFIISTFLLSGYTGRDKEVFLKACQMGVNETFNAISIAEFDSPSYVNIIESCEKVSVREKIKRNLNQSGCEFAIRAVYGQFDLDISAKLSSEQQEIVKSCVSRLE